MNGTSDWDVGSDLNGHDDQCSSLYGRALGRGAACDCGVKEFPIADVLSVTTGVLLSDRMSSMIAVLEFMRNTEAAGTAWLMYAAVAATDRIYEQHPWIEELSDLSELPGLEAKLDRVKEYADIHGSLIGLRR